MRRLAAGCVAASLVAAAAFAQEKAEREKKVRDDKAHVESGGAWIYDDLPRGIDESKKSGKPLLVVFRCIPCEACAKLDEDVVDRDPTVAKLLDRFVCVRVPHMNGVDLSIFQFDFGQSWAAFFLTSDLTILGRYGTRSSQKDSADDVSLEGFAKAMEAALEFQTMGRRAFLVKRPLPADVKTPEEFPSLKGRYGPTIDWKGDVVPTCIHCHMIEQARRTTYREAGEPIPIETLFPYPNPKSIGLVMDPKEKARVRSVVAGSLAQKQGFRAGDDIVTLAGSPVLSIADVQWVLEQIADVTKVFVVAGVRRDGRDVNVEMRFPPGWRQAGDISWRASSWDLRRMTTGGLVLEDVPDEERGKLGLDAKSLALRVKFVGQYGEHAAAKEAGFRKDDVIVAAAGESTRLTESGWMAAFARTTKRGDKVAVTVLRDGKKLDLTLPMQ